MGSQAKYLSAIEKLGDQANESRISKLTNVSRTAAHNALVKLQDESLVHRDGIIWRIGEPPDDPQEKMDFE